MIGRELIVSRLRRMDWLVFAALAGLMVLGILFIYSSCYRSADEPVSGLYRKQIVWAMVGLTCYLAFALTDYQFIVKNAWWFYAGAVFLLVLVLLVGVKTNNASRWLKLFGTQIQPSELAKIGTLLALTRYLGRPGRDLRSPRVLLPVAILVGLPFLLIAREPDLGTAAVLLPLALVMLFVAGVPVRTLALLSLAALLFLPVGWLVLDDYQKDRILVFFDPGRDPLGAGWNKIQSEIAVGSGGLAGKGYLKGTQNVLGYLPSTVAPTDFIYSVIAEETGFVGSTLILALYAAVVVAGMRTALGAQDRFGRLLTVGVMALLFCHVFVNIAMTVGLMPITGLPLPLISYGGSFMVCTMMALGMVQSVYVRRYRR